MLTIVIAILIWRKSIEHDPLTLGLAMLLDAVLFALFCGMMLSFIPK